MPGIRDNLFETIDVVGTRPGAMLRANTVFDAVLAFKIFVLQGYSPSKFLCPIGKTSEDTAEWRRFVANMPVLIVMRVDQPYHRPRYVTDG